jgi:hypothetical protein
MGLSFVYAAGLASAVFLGSESLGTRDHILLSVTGTEPSVASILYPRGQLNRRILQESPYVASAPITHRKHRSMVGTCLPNHCIPTIAVLISQKNSHVIPRQRIHWCAACCTATSNKHLYYSCVRFNEFTESLSSNALAIYVTIYRTRRMEDVGYREVHNL